MTLAPEAQKGHGIDSTEPHSHLVKWVCKGGMGLLGCLLALGVASAYASGGRLTLPGSALAATQNTAAAPAEPVVHNNNRPLIGILAQACHRCPGKCAPGPVWGS